MKKRIVVVGSGETGTMLAIILSRAREAGLISHDISVVLLDILAERHHGGIAASVVNHATGFEYFKPHHLQSSEMCIQGALAKALLYPPGFFRSRFPNSFYISTASSRSAVPVSQFLKNAESLRSYFANRFHQLTRDLRVTESELQARIGYGPDDFGHQLHSLPVHEIADVIGGCSSAGGAVNMATIYAINKSALDQGKRNHTVTEQSFGEVVVSIRNCGNKTIVKTHAKEYDADIVVLSAANGIPGLAALAGGVGQPGTYYLNATLYLRLPPTSDALMRVSVARTNFVLQGEHGCMYSCILTPTTELPGIAAVYFPSPLGSQIAEQRYDSDHSAASTAEWYQAISDHNHSNIQVRAERIFAQAVRFNPFLKNYAEYHSVAIRPVFSGRVAGNQGGADRRVRGLSLPIAVEAGGRVVAMSSPKWTTVELTSLTLMQKILQILDEPLLPVCAHGYGPFKLDVAAIQRHIHLHDVAWRHDYAVDYATDMGFPQHFASDHPFGREKQGS
jgi:hypothetical protein